LKNGLIGGVLSGIISALLNYSILPFPQSIQDNAIGHGFSGFFSGLISAVIAVLIYIRHLQQRKNTICSSD
jgi:uncharacterized membrane protein YeaQ/YmgE (transglycosylase-associated protein family)